MPWTTWGRFAHNSPRARVKVHLPRVLESRSVGQRALAPPTDGHPPAFRNPQRQFSHYATAFRPRYDATNRHSTTTFSQPFAQPSNNRFLAPRQPSETSTHSQPSFNRHVTASQSQPRLNCFPITFQPPEATKRTIPRLANIHDSTILRVEASSFGNNYNNVQNNILFLASKPRGVLESAGMLPAVEVVLSVVVVASFITPTTDTTQPQPNDVKWAQERPFKALCTRSAV